MAKIRYFSGLHFLPLELLGDLGLELHISNLGAIYKGRPKIFAIFTPSPRPQNLAFYRQNLAFYRQN